MDAYPYLDYGCNHVRVDLPDSCHDQHDGRSAPLYHVVRSSGASATTIRCPKSLSPDEKKKLREPASAQDLLPLPRPKPPKRQSRLFSPDALD